MTMNELESVYCFEVVLTINGLLVVFTPGEEILQLCNIRILPDLVTSSCLRLSGARF